MPNIPTPHINCYDVNLIAKTVLMPGDPLRAKYIADTYLEDVICFNETRGMFGYTGYYNNKRISVMGSGMGMPSIGIYSYELFNFYGVENIVRIGTCGGFDPNLKVGDVLLAKTAYSDSSFAKVGYNISSHKVKSSLILNNKLKKAAKKLNIPLTDICAYSSDVFYESTPDRWISLRDDKKCQCVEMEAFALYTTANVLGKNASCILTISDSFTTGDKLSAEERQTSLNNMIKIALELAE